MRRACHRALRRTWASGPGRRAPSSPRHHRRRRRLCAACGSSCSDGSAPVSRTCRAQRAASGGHGSREKPAARSQWARLADSAPRHHQKAEIFSSDVCGDGSAPTQAARHQFALSAMIGWSVRGRPSPPAPASHPRDSQNHLEAKTAAVAWHSKPVWPRPRPALGGQASCADLAHNASAPAPRAFGDLPHGHFKGVLAACAPRAASLVHCQSGQPAGVITPHSFPQQAELVQQWRPGAVLSKVHLSRHCGLHRTAQAPQRAAPRAATMVPQSAVCTAPSGRRAGVTETEGSPRPRNQWAQLADSASRHRQEAKATRQRIIKALCCSSTAWPEQKQREHARPHYGLP